MSKPLEGRAGFEPATSRKCLRVCFLKAPSAHIAATRAAIFSQSSGNLLFENHFCFAEVFPAYQHGLPVILQDLPHSRIQMVAPQNPDLLLCQFFLLIVHFP